MRGAGRLFLFLGAMVFGQTQDPEAAAVASLYQAQQWAEAVRMATALATRSADTDLMLGLSLAHLGRLDEAAGVFSGARRAYPRDPRFPLELAGVAYRRNDPAEAKRLLLQALSVDPRNEYGNSFLGSLFLLDGNLPAALKYWNRVDKPLIQDVHLRPVPGLDPLLRDRALWVSGGQVLSVRNLETTMANLDRLAVFSNYQFDLSAAPGERYDLTVRSLGRRLPLKRWMAIAPLARGLPYQTVFVDMNNLGRRAINVESLFRWDPLKQRLAVRLSAPWRLSPRWIYHAGFDARDEDWDLSRTYSARGGRVDGLRLRSASLDARVVHALNARLEWRFGMKSAYRSYLNSDRSSFFRDGWSGELFTGFDGKLWSRPENRIRMDSSVTLRTGRLFSSQRTPYHGLSGGARLVWLPEPKGDNLAVSASARAGKLFGAPPFDELFMLGMERDNELWMRGHAGTRGGRKGAAPLGTQYAILQTELDRTALRFPMARLQLGPFLDTGRIGDPLGRFGSGGWMVDTGAQAKLRLLGAFTWTFVYGRDLRRGRGVFYTAIQR